MPPKDPLDLAIRDAIATGLDEVLGLHRPVNGHCYACATWVPLRPTWPCRHYLLAQQAQRAVREPGSGTASDIASATATGSTSRP